MNVIEAVRGAPRILFTKGGSPWLAAIMESGCDAVGLDGALSQVSHLSYGPILLGIVAVMPFMALKVVFAIHWQALRLWWRGAAVRRKARPFPARDSEYGDEE